MQEICFVFLQVLSPIHSVTPEPGPFSKRIVLFLHCITVSPFSTAHTFYASRYGSRRSDFFWPVSTNLKVPVFLRDL